MICKLTRDLALRAAAWLLSASAWAGSLEVRSPSAKITETSPGRIVTASAVVANRGSADDDFSETLTLPAGWTRIAPAEIPFTLAPSGQIVRVIAISVPDSAAAGSYPIQYRVQGRKDPSAMDDLTLSILVSAVTQLELALEPHPDPVFAGDTYELRGEVTNHGNSRLAVSLAHRSSLGLPVTLSPATFTLAPGETRGITGKVTTDPKQRRRESHAVTVDLRATAANGKVLTARRAAVADIIPLIDGDPDVHHRLPVQFRLTGVMERGHDAQVQAELSGAGSLDEAGRQRIDFVFRGPDIENNTVFGQRDEYGLSLRGERWGIDLGDRVFSLSPLTEKHSFGRGIGITYDGDLYDAGAFYMRTRYRATSTEELGAYLRRHFRSGLSFQASYLRKWGGEGFEARDLPQNIFSAEARYEHGKALDLRLEYGVALTDSGTRDDGYRIEARGALGEFHYALEHAHAGPRFHGYYNDTDTTYLSLSRPIRRGLQATASVNRYAGNLEQNPERSSVVNREQSWTAGLRQELGKKSDVSIDWRHVEREDILAPAAYNFVEDSIRLGGSYNFGKLRMRSFLDFGTLDNSLTDESGPFQRYSVFATYQPTARQQYSVFATYGPSAFSGSRDHALNCGLSADWQLKNGLGLNVSYARNQFDSLTGHEQDQVLARARYRFKNQDEISVSGRWMTAAAGTDKDEAAVMVTFSRPLGVPVSRKTSIGGVAGTLAVEGQPIPKAIVRAGDRYAVTDAAGHFTFTSLKPGTHEVQVLNDSLKPDVVMSARAPASVVVQGAKTTSVALEARKAATVTVKVLRYKFGPNGTYDLVGGQEGCNVELRRGEDRIVEQTDRAGNATFQRLPFGQWNLEVAGENLPAHHTLENPSRTLDLKAGTPAEMTVRVLPLRRKLMIIDQGVIH